MGGGGGHVGREAGARGVVVVGGFWVCGVCVGGGFGGVWEVFVGVVGVVGCGWGGWWWLWGCCGWLLVCVCVGGWVLWGVVLVGFVFGGGVLFVGCVGGLGGVVLLVFFLWVFFGCWLVGLGWWLLLAGGAGLLGRRWLVWACGLGGGWLFVGVV
ncbi:hypothetical protein RA275_27520, partial [Pseudomonas syringae pv. tagetis]